MIQDTVCCGDNLCPALSQALCVEGIKEVAEFTKEREQTLCYAIKSIRSTTTGVSESIEKRARLGFYLSVRYQPNLSVHAGRHVSFGS
jgi:hypothetical protein